MKACAFLDVLQTLAPSLEGFAVSSLFEARMVHQMCPDSAVHLTTPGLRDCEIDELAEICDFVVFNSETQLNHFGPRVSRHASVGIRVNTLISNVKDPRYDPARLHSQLGVPLKLLPRVISSSYVKVSGLHFHTNADSIELTELEANVEALVDSTKPDRKFDWVNFGGGYLFAEVPALKPLQRCVEITKSEMANEVYVRTRRWTCTPCWLPACQRD